MRRATTPLQNQTSEPLIVVDEPNVQEEPEKEKAYPSTDNSSNEESPTMNPYLLSPWRDARETRKHSLPTPQCSGITASQVRRLSERGEETRPGPRQTEFLATLSTAPAPVPGGRRHSVVTISKVPSSLFGRNRRESVAAYPPGSRILPNRRDSATGPPSTEPRGSVHNLQLDIMDDIVQARKVRMKLWNTSNERVCEVQPMDDSGGVQRYTNPASRRFSDFVGTTLAPIPSSSKRRASELQQPINKACSSSTASKLTAPGIICTNTDLISILSSLASSAMEINQCEQPSSTSESNKSMTAEQRRNRLKTNRSNSFDISILHDTINKNQNWKNQVPSSWFVKRHQPAQTTETNVRISNSCEKIKIINEKENKSKKNKEESKVLWDERSGSLVDAHILGSAIEVFLRRSGPETTDTPTTTIQPPITTLTPPSTTIIQSSSSQSPSTSSSSFSTVTTSSATTTTSTLTSTSKGAIPKITQKNQGGIKSKSSWFSNKNDDDSTETCDSSICSTLKDLFVK